jgi:hypothetical protein
MYVPEPPPSVNLLIFAPENPSPVQAPYPVNSDHLAAFTTNRPARSA